jgi:tRNA1(Val) A37 N6-methylase TrmN6
LLGGLVHYSQAVDGYRTGIEPVLLAASVPARPGDRVVEGGTGAGAGLMCLAARVPGIAGTGIELNEGTAALARQNVAANGFADLSILIGDVEGWRPESTYDHALANPPWHDAGGTAPANAARALAKRARPGLLSVWAASLANGLRPRGTLSLILPARCLAEGMAAFGAAQCREITVIPLWPRQGVAAKLVILRGVRLGAGPCAVHPGLVLHEADGAYTEAASAILRCTAAFA